MRIRWLFLVGVVLVSGCASMKNSLLLGMGAGATTGAVTGAVMSSQYRAHYILSGALIGGAIGGLAGFLAHKGFESRDDQVRRDTLLNLQKFDVSAPKPMSQDGPRLSMPTVESEWVDTQVQGKKLIEGHRVWIISEDPQWIPQSTQQKDKK